MRFFTSGACLLFALFCVYGFLASGELTGSRELAWRIGYAIVGIVSLTAAIGLARRRK